MPALQLTADEHPSRRIDAVNLKHRLGDVETDCRDRLHAWLPITATAPAAITSMALTRRCGSRPQHQKRPTPSTSGLRNPPSLRQSGLAIALCEMFAHRGIANGLRRDPVNDGEGRQARHEERRLLARLLDAP